MKIILTLLTIVLSMSVTAQDSESLPYHQIPVQPDSYTAGTVVSRMIDGLGFRFYWATEGLTPNDLDFKLKEDARPILDVMSHVYSMSAIIRDAALQVPHIRETFKKPLSYMDLRRLTLQNYKIASDIFKKADHLESFNIVFKGSDSNRVVPFWNAINGPIEDSVWHCGQIATSRRNSGNPINPKINHFTGTVSE
ncbi:hypothetical protein [Formosa algae]|uniref:DinB-like domain-containing protein n=1 Tax=Formosa algae TaxID=225843 RepID=A0A9X1CBV1_9FLAO|nr:hypothetical protein [Formosa algae]MBP1839600.1 hypothetical protein [Formosa algae]MDQ0334904.1 hypothetical protein [Formosa algae]OEI80596.1 hypothetical protein AST99_08395 [Formosa algae]